MEHSALVQPPKTPEALDGHPLHQLLADVETGSVVDELVKVPPLRQLHIEVGAPLLDWHDGLLFFRYRCP